MELYVRYDELAEVRELAVFKVGLLQQRDEGAVHEEEEVLRLYPALELVVGDEAAGGAHAVFVEDNPDVVLGEEGVLILQELRGVARVGVGAAGVIEAEYAAAEQRRAYEQEEELPAEREAQVERARAEDDADGAHDIGRAPVAAVEVAARLRHARELFPVGVLELAGELAAALERPADSSA